MTGSTEEPFSVRLDWPGTDVQPHEAPVDDEADVDEAELTDGPVTPDDRSDSSTDGPAASAATALRPLYDELARIETRLSRLVRERTEPTGEKPPLPDLSVLERLDASQAALAQELDQVTTQLTDLHTRIAVEPDTSALEDIRIAIISLGDRLAEEHDPGQVLEVLVDLRSEVNERTTASQRDLATLTETVAELAQQATAQGEAFETIREQLTALAPSLEASARETANTRKAVAELRAELIETGPIRRLADTVASLEASIPSQSDIPVQIDTDVIEAIAAEVVRRMQLFMEVVEG